LLDKVSGIYFFKSTSNINNSR